MYMKKLFSTLLLAMSVLTMQAQTDKYEAELQEVVAQAQAIIDEYNAICEKDPNGEKPANKARIDQIAEQMDALQESKKQLILRIAHENPKSMTPAKYIEDVMYDLSLEELAEILNPKAAYYNAPEMGKVKKLYEGMKKRQPGQMFQDLTMKDMNDQVVKLSQWAGQGKYVLVDFWASWCGPCRREMPNVVANYKRYKDSGLEIVGVSFDQKKKSWVDAVQQLGMNWPQMSDLKGWKCAAAEVYGISGIPSNLLLNPQGEIIAIDLTGNELSEKLAEIFQ